MAEGRKLFKNCQGCNLNEKDCSLTCPALSMLVSRTQMFELDYWSYPAGILFAVVQLKVLTSSFSSGSSQTIQSHLTHRPVLVQSVAYPGNFFRGEVQHISVEDRGQREQGSGDGSPLVTAGSDK